MEKEKKVFEEAQGNPKPLTPEEAIIINTPHKTADEWRFCLKSIH